jgi:hypothetical protein
LKACRLFTGTASKRNPDLWFAGLLQMTSNRIGDQSAAAVLASQLFHQVPKARGQLGMLGAKVLLQPFADGAANRPAGGTVELFAALVEAGHRQFRFVWVGHEHQVICTGMVSLTQAIACAFRKNRMNAPAGSSRRTQGTTTAPLIAHIEAPSAAAA